MTRTEKNIEKIKNEILGKQYELSFAFISKNKIKSLNKEYRKKDEPTDILSFPLSKNSGEILICLDMVKKKYKQFLDPITNKPITYENYLIFLFIHGCLHLKGMDHGDLMEKAEKKYYKKFLNL